MRILTTFILGLFFVNGNSQCLSGTYTVGGSSPNYVDFSSAINAISTNGICGHVVFKVRPGTYNEYVLIPTWSTSATKTVTFESETGDSTSVVVLSDSIYAVRIECKYVTINKISLQAIGDNAYGSVGIYSPSQDVKISGCVISHTGGVIYGQGVQISDANNVTIQNNRVYGMSMGVAASGIGTGFTLSNILIDNNIIDSDYNGSSMENINGLTFTNNIINAGTYAVDVGPCKGSVIFEGNDIKGNEGGVVFVDFDAVSDLEVYNNFILVASGASAATGMVLQSIPQAEVYHNTVRITSSVASDATLTLSFGGTHMLRNNIFLNGSSGPTFYIQSGGTYTMDNNLYYNTGTNIGYDNAYGSISTLAAYTTLTGREASGMQINPQLVSSMNLHLKSTSPAIDVAFNVGITNDIDGEIREPLSDLGADEYYPPIGVIEFEKKGNNIRVYPNPTNGLIQMEFYGQDQPESVNIYDVLGNLLRVVPVINSTVDMRTCPSGVYLIGTPVGSVKCIKY